jgi:hypothetical protein
MSAVLQFTPRRVEREVAAVIAVKDQLAALGKNEAEYLEISIESETGFRELMEELVDRVQDAASLVAAAEVRIEGLKDKIDRLKTRQETLRLVMAAALDSAGLPKIETGVGTVSLRRLPAEAIVTDESEIPTQFWKTAPPPDPKLDKKALTAALRGRETAITAAMAITDPDEREAALAAVETQFPAVPGASLSNGGATIAIRS